MRRRDATRTLAFTQMAMAVASFAASTALAGEPETPPAPALPPPPPITRRVPEVVVRAVEPATLPEDPSAFTTVIDVNARRAEGRTVTELLEESPGVQVRRFGGEGQLAEISIRGSTASQVVVQLDGIPLNSAQTGAVDLSTIPAGLLERIEVVRGGGSVQTGSDAIGGVVNLVTRRPGGPRRTDNAVSGGSFGTWNGSMATSGTLRDVEYAAAYNGFRTEGDFEFQRSVLEVGDIAIEPVPASATRINNEAVQHAGLLTLGGELGERFHLLLRDVASYGSRGQPGLDAGSVGEAGQRPDAHEYATRNLASATLTGAGVSPLGLATTFDAWHSFARVRFRDPDFVPGVGAPIDTTDRNDEIGVRMRVEREVEWLGVRHRLSGVGEGGRAWLDSDSFDDQGRNEGALAVQNDAALLENRLRLVPALRFDKTQGFDAQWLPRFGVIAAPFPWLHLKGNVERSFRVPNFDELYFPDRGFLRGNPGLEPEDAVNADVGFEIGAERLGPVEDAWLEAAWFHNDVANSIVYVLVSPSLVEPRNTSDATIEGVEVALRMRVLQWVGIEAQYTHLDATLDSTGLPLPGRADDEAHVRVEVSPPSRAVRAIGSVQITSEIPVSESGSTTLPGRSVYDASLIFDLTRLGLVPAVVPIDSLLLTLEGRNLTDQSVRDAQFFPQPGRLFALRLETSW